MANCLNGFLSETSFLQNLSSKKLIFNALDISADLLLTVFGLALRRWDMFCCFHDTSFSHKKFILEYCQRNAAAVILSSEFVIPVLFLKNASTITLIVLLSSAVKLSLLPNPSMIFIMLSFRSCFSILFPHFI